MLWYEYRMHVAIRILKDPLFIFNISHAQKHCRDCGDNQDRLSLLGLNKPRVCVERRKWRGRFPGLSSVTIPSRPTPENPVEALKKERKVN